MFTSSYKPRGIGYMEISWYWLSDSLSLSVCLNLSLSLYLSLSCSRQPALKSFYTYYPLYILSLSHSLASLACQVHLNSLQYTFFDPNTNCLTQVREPEFNFQILIILAKKAKFREEYIIIDNNMILRYIMQFTIDYKITSLMK